MASLEQVESTVENAQEVISGQLAEVEDHLAEKLEQLHAAASNTTNSADVNVEVTPVFKPEFNVDVYCLEIHVDSIFEVVGVYLHRRHVVLGDGQRSVHLALQFALRFHDFHLTLS